MQLCSRLNLGRQSHLESKLLLLNPRHDTSQRDDRCNNDSPQLDVKNRLIIARLRSCSHSHQRQRKHHIPIDPMVLPDLLRILHSPIQLRHEILREPYYRLNHQQSIGDYAENCVRRFEVRDSVLVLVHLDDHEATEESEEPDVICGGMDICSCFLLGGGMGWLEDEGALGYEDEAG
jgi:hypothetical protein